MKYGFIKEQQAHYPITLLCRVMEVGSSSYYDWLGSDKSGVVSHDYWRLCQQMKALFRESKESLGSRQMMKQLRKEGFAIGRYRTRKLMVRLKLAVKRKKRYLNTTDSKHQQPVADNLLNREFTPTGPNRVWTTDITYIWTLQGWVYLAVVLDLYSRRVVGWSLGNSMETALVVRALTMATNLRNPAVGLLHHSDRGSQYASREYQQLLKQHGMVCSMSRKGNCWDNAPTERFFSSLKREWLTGNHYATRAEAIRDVRDYIAYYNSRRLHTTIGDRTPMDFEAGIKAKCP